MMGQNNQWALNETSERMCRLFERMKKLLLLSTVFLGTALASHAGVDVHIGFGFPLPPLPRIVIGAPAPCVVVSATPAVVYAPPVCAPAPVVVVSPVVCAPRPVILAPYPRVIVAPPYAYYSHRYEYLHHHR
jgi:hypothetical protein